MNRLCICGHSREFHEVAGSCHYMPTSTLNFCPCLSFRPEKPNDMNLKKYLSECHNVEAVYFACEDWGAFLCTKCGEKCKADEVEAAVECGTLMHASDGITCANIKPCFLHDPEENKKWREKIEPKDDIEHIVEEFDAKFPDKQCGKGWGCDNCGGCLDEDIDRDEARVFLHSVLLSHGKAEREKGEIDGWQKGAKEARAHYYDSVRAEAKKDSYTKGIEDSIAAIILWAEPGNVDNWQALVKTLETLKNK